MSGLLNELKRRNVLRVTVLYIVGAWLVLQVAEVLLGILEVPPWGSKLVLAVLVVLFPLVLVFTWAFEITPEGIKRESEIDRSRSITAETGKKINVLTGALAGIAILLIVAQGLFPGLQQPRSGSRAGASNVAAAGVSTASIAVLPFANMSSDKEQEYFSDGLSEELLNLLAKIPQLKVISRTSSFQFKGKNEDVRMIGQRLGVAHVLEGSVRKSANRVRITAQLIKAEDGSHVWSETYDRNLDDIFAVQDEIAGEVVKALRVTILGAAPEIHAKPQNTAAYQFVLKARHFYAQRTPEAHLKGLAQLDSAIALDPEYAIAWAERSRIVSRQAGNGEVPLDAGVTRARGYAERALELDPDLPEALMAAARVENQFDWNWQRADAHIRQAEALDPSNYNVLLERSALSRTLGRFTEAVAADRRLAELNPLRPEPFHYLSFGLMRADSLSAASAAIRKAIELDPHVPNLHWLWSRIAVAQGKPQEALAAALKESDEFWRLHATTIAYAALGRVAESDRGLRELEERNAHDAAFQIAEVYAFRGQADQAFRWLDRAYDQRDPGLTEIIGDPLLENIVGDPRYRSLLHKLKLPES